MCSNKSFMLNSICIQSCPQPLIPDLVSRICCHESCATCFGEKDSECDTCPPDSYQQGSFCFKCHPDCETCTGLGNLACLSCKLPPSTLNYLYQGRCYDICPVLTEPQGRSCVSYSCHDTCLTCSGSAINKCETCPENRFKTSMNTCQSCHQECLTCDGGLNTDCLSCGVQGIGGNASQYYLDSDGICKSECPEGKFKHEITPG